MQMHRPRAVAVALLCAAAVLIAQGCSGSAGNGRGAAIASGGPDLLLITIDTLRHDAVGFAGTGLVETPTIDRLAARGVVFTETHAHAVVTLPSHTSILTGLLPTEHGVRDNAGFVLGEDVPTLASLLRAHGFTTGAFVSAFPLDQRFGLDRGFERYDDEYGADRREDFSISERPDEKTVARAKTWWDAHRGQRRFLWLHLFGPHSPYEPGAPWSSLYEGRPYFGEVARSDAALAPLLGPLLHANDPSAVVVLTSDHGESLGEHGEWGHGLLAYETTLKVPLVIWAPGALDAARSETPARHIDLAPTILELLGLTPPDHLPGRSLVAGPSSDPGCYFEAMTGFFNRGWAPLDGWVEGNRKGIRAPIAELYDLERDPQELSNLVTERPDLLRELLSRLPEPAATIDRGEPDEEVVARLQALGYVTASVDVPSIFDASLDPKNLLGVQEALAAAADSYRRGDAAAAARMLEAQIDVHPRTPVLYLHLARVHLKQSNLDRTTEVLQRAVDLDVDDEPIRIALAHAWLRAGDAARAASVLEADRDSSNPECQHVLGTIAFELGRLDEARKRFERALEIDATFPAAELDLGLLALRDSRYDVARPLLERAVQGNPSVAKAWNALGVARAETGDLREAADAWEQASRVDPRFPDPLFNLAGALERLGQDARARAVLERYVRLVEGEKRRRAEALIRLLDEREPKQ
jgi:arylsulfatase A-like enzyme/Flp pilus assembly protein TadD